MDPVRVPMADDREPFRLGCMARNRSNQEIATSLVLAYVVPACLVIQWMTLVIRQPLTSIPANR
jgi:hypothetical protein